MSNLANFFDCGREDRSLDLFFPEAEECPQHRKFRKGVVALPDEIQQQLARIQAADAKMKSLLLPADECLWGDEVAEEEGWTREQNWWYFGIPSNAGNALSSELIAE